MTPGERKFWRFVAERESIRLKRERGEPPPWTRDATFRKYSFTNIRRVDDPDTLFTLSLIEHGAQRPLDYFWRAYIARFINRKETFEKYGMPKRNIQSVTRWTHQLVAARARHESIGAPQHLTFWSRAMAVLDSLIDDHAFARELQMTESGIDAAFILAARKPPLYIGPYFATLIIGDLSLTPGFGARFGPNTEVPIGNGARVGLKLVDGMRVNDAHALFAEKGVPSRRNRSLKFSCDPRVIARIKELLATRPRDVTPLTFMDMENALCEYGRYVRVASGIEGIWQKRIRREEN